MKRLGLILLALFLAINLSGQGTTCPTGSIALAAPANGVTVSSPVTFSWSAINGSVAYRLWLAPDGGSPALINRVTGTSVTQPLPSGSGEWYIEAVLPTNCPSIFSPRYKITVRPSTTCGTNPVPTIVAPMGTAAQPAVVKTSVDFSWNPSPGASEYHVFVAPFGLTAFDDLGLTKETRFKRDFEPGTYIWFVVAIFDGCPAVRSDVSVFRIEASGPRCGTVAPAVLSPAENTPVNSPATLSWSAVPNAAFYRVYASVAGSELFPLAETTETTISRPLPPGQVVWFVEATFHGCPSTRSPAARFTILRSGNCSNQRPQNVSPANGSDVGSAVTFSWSPVAGALRYVVIVRGADGEPAAIGETTATQLSRLLPAVEVEWWVVAFLSGCDPAQSDHSRFTVTIPAGCETRRAILLTPVDDALGVTSPARFSWTPVRGARSYRVFAAVAEKDPALIATTTSTETTGNVPPGRVRWYVESAFDNCPALLSAVRDFLVTTRSTQCRTPDKPTGHLVGQVLSGNPYKLRWTPIQNASGYEVQESSTADFANATTQVTAEESAAFTRSVTANAAYHYRVRAVSSCSDDRGPYSEPVRINVIVPDASKPRGTAEVGVQQNVVQTLFIPGADSPVTFNAQVEKKWLTVTPSSGTIPPQGLTLTLSVDPSTLFLGANMGIVRITYGASGKTASAVQPASSTVSVSLVTPLVPGGRNTPPPDALIIPAVAHAAGVNNAQFESDVRVLNTSTQPMTYQLNFTPSGVDGTITGSSTIIEVDPGATTALNDILSSFFGTAPSESTTGMLEIRPLTSPSTSSAFTGTSSKLVTVASSRTYNATVNGTFGQYIPAIPFSQFIGKSQILSLQQIAESPAFRTNFGLVEASGESAEVVMRVYDRLSRQVGEIPFSLAAAQHMKLDRLLATNGITLDEGRVEVEVTSSTGKVSVYASTIDNISGDPLLVPPVLKSSASGTRYVLPGIAFINGLAAWRSDVRLFNTAASSVNATLAYFPQGATSAANTTTVSIAAGEVKSYDNILNSLFGISDTSGGSLLVTTPSTSNLITSARTYAQTDAGTYGQFIPGVTPAESVGRGERSLNVLQLEHSDNFRTNIGLVETSGNSITAEVTLILPDSKVTAKVPIDLPPNGFFQFPLSSFGITTAIFNARVTVKVVSGNGRVSAYGSVIDNLSKDPTYVPAQ